MNELIEPGKYVVAVSGGVDSVVLLDMLTRQPDLRLTVAHFDHGIRKDSKSDRIFVQELAHHYGVPFVYAEGNLGAKASEATARKARYEFLHKVLKSTGAKAIITAHHEDDMLETALLNLMRGTGRKGLASLTSKSGLRRPLLGFSKRQIKAYAHYYQLAWREDSTNSDLKYKRNYLRHEIMPKFDPATRHKLRTIIDDTQLVNSQLDMLIINELHAQPSTTMLNRHWFIMLPHKVATEVMSTWLRARGFAGFDKKTIERLVASVKVANQSKIIDVNGDYALTVSGDNLALLSRDR